MKNRRAMQAAERHAHDMRLARVRITLWIIGGLLLFTAAVAAFAVALMSGIRKERSARAEQTAEIVVNGAGVMSWEEFFETELPADDPAPGGVRRELPPVEPVDGVYFGAAGYTCEEWEMDLFTRIVSREVCGCSRECWRAIADSILARLYCGFWGDTLGGVLAAKEVTGAWAYTTYPLAYIGEIELYDEIREVCETAFAHGILWDPAAKYFNLGGYPAWAVPMYELDGVYFSASPWLEGWR